ncbi:hypothetical protein C8T65DRAFT_692842 [Cerioporus squamosus]|nr:hypothetical protein C8T65DRAFT_692842 [Cerioporus squamosus]
MPDRNIPDKSLQGKNGYLPASRSPSPIILVPATPTTPGQDLVATDDEITPPRPNQLSPRSYAQVAALPAANVSAVVWPVNTPAISEASSTTQSTTSVEVNSTATRQESTEASLQMPSTPRIQPQAQQEDITEVLQLPPPAFPWAGAQNMSSLQTANVIDNASCMPTSSPIYVPSSASTTPTPSGVLGQLPSAPRAFGTTGSQGVDSYEEFWAHLNTPVISESNLPSALQTPRVLNLQTNNVISGSPWPAGALSNGPLADFLPPGLENLPPSFSTPGSHPPVASRQRKRRRGVTPASGEREKKLAKRKGKARVSAGANENRIPATAENPWATASTGYSAEVLTNRHMPPPSSLPSSSIPSTANQTPYTDYSRSGSMTTSFYRRFNDSGSYPTPHAVSSSSSSSQVTPAWGTPRQNAWPHTMETAAPEAPRRHLQGSNRATGASDVSARLPSHLASTPSLLDLPDSSRSAMDVESSQASEQRADTRRTSRLCDILSDPSVLDEPVRGRRSATVEGTPEEGEAGSSMDRRQSVDPFGWSPSRPASRYSMEATFSHTPRDDSDWRDRDPDTAWRRHSQRRRTSSRFSPGGMGGSSMGDWDAFTPRHMAREDANVRLSPPRTSILTRGSPFFHRHYGSTRPTTQHPPALSSTSSNQLHNLDIFDIGDDDNLPGAVRRGGSAAETENERPTPIPREGDPEVHLHDPESHLRGMSDDWVQQAWADPERTSITMSTFNARFSRSYGVNRRTAMDMRRGISSITGESNFLVIAPDQDLNHQGRGPTEWAITGLSQDAVGLLLRRRVWSFRSITFFPRRRALDIPTWLLALEGFLDDNVVNIEAAVRSTFERPQVRQRIEQMIRVNPEFKGIAPEEAFRRVMATLRVTIYTLDNETVVANVFLRSPTLSIRVWRRWIQELRDLTFGSFQTAIARVRRVTSCSGCQGVDHPSHLCPFLRMPGWNGPISAGMSSYSVDGRERQSRQATTGTASTLTSQRDFLNQSTDNPALSQAGPSRPRQRNANYDWEDAETDRGREYGGRGRGRDRDYNRRTFSRVAAQTLKEEKAIYQTKYTEFKDYRTSGRHAEVYLNEISVHTQSIRRKLRSLLARSEVYISPEL